MDSHKRRLPADLWESIFDAIPEGITVHSRDGKIEHANRAVQEIYGKPLDHFVGRPCEEVFHLSDGDCPHEQVSARRGERIETRYELDGRLYSVTHDPILDSAGELKGYIRIMREVTEVQKAQEQLLKAERFATLGQMISGIAHDIGTPLNIISGYAEYLLVRTRPDAQGHKELSTILQQTRRIADFIKQMLDLSRLGQERTDPISLKGFLAESLDLMSHHFRKAGVKATLTCEGNPPLIYGDAPKLRQAFFNLLLNVFQRTGPGSKLEIVIVEPDGSEGVVQILIKGTEASGKGHDFSASFSDYLSPNSAGKVLGLGLSLAREVLNESSATVRAVESDGDGVPLAISLPIKKAGVAAK